MKLVLIACAGLMAGSAAFAQEAMNSGHLAALDTNGDGGVDSAEFGDFIAKSFRSVDANADGLLTADETANIMTPDLFQSADADGSGGISQDEFAGQAQNDFTAADLDGDGVLN